MSPFLTKLMVGNFEICVLVNAKFLTTDFTKNNSWGSSTKSTLIWMHLFFYPTLSFPF